MYLIKQKCFTYMTAVDQIMLVVIVSVAVLLQQV